MITLAPTDKPNILRRYQVEMRQAWHAFVDRGGQRGLIVGATGTGKNTVISAIVESHSEADPGFATLILAHQQELLRQTGATIDRQTPWLSTGYEIAEQRCRQGTRVALGSVQTLGGRGCTRLDWLAPNLVVTDEGHHSAAKSYQNVFRRMRCYEEYGTLLLGVTATAHRLDQLALYGSEKAVFQELVYEYPIVQAIREGFLVDIRGFRAAADFDLSKVKIKHGDYEANALERAVNTDAVNELAFKSWQEVAADRQTIIFCTGVDHAKDVALLFKAHGVKAEAVWGDMAKSDRADVLKRFQAGEIQVLTNMALLTEGFDAVWCSCILQLRPTQSWTLFTQMVGRALRTLPWAIEGITDNDERREAVRRSQKPDCIVIDIVSNSSAHSLAGIPDSENIPSLQALVGLPSALDMEGRTVAEAVEEFEKLPDIVKAAAYRRQTSFSGLTATLTQVDMLKELEMPEELADAGAKLQWLKTGANQYTCDLGYEVGSLLRKFANLRGDHVGNWHLHYAAFEGTRRVREDVTDLPIGDLATAMLAAEDYIRRTVPGVMRNSGKDATWRVGAPTDDQVRALRQQGIDDSVIGEMNRGIASKFLTSLKANGGFLELQDGGQG